MKKSGIADLPLHYGKVPRWLFSRMVKLSRAIVDVILYEFSEEELLRRLSDPYWFQALSCVLGFDWHSSGTTTTTCAALKAAISPEEHGIAICGGKGMTSRKTPEEIEKFSELFSLSSKDMESLVYASRIVAKVDNSCIQDGYQLYHHVFIFTEKARWCVIQQGMNNKLARRYHWLSENVKNFVDEPHSAICCDKIEKEVLNMVARESENSRKISVDLVREGVKRIERDLRDLEKLVKLKMPYRHVILGIDLSKADLKFLRKAHELQPENYEELVALKGMGPKKIRALALISELIYGEKPSWKDPAKFSFAHGGKDGYPYPVNKKVYDASIKTLEEAIEQAKLGNREKQEAIKRLHRLVKL
ncbi:MAG: DUF763 domain-containing protein [Candidatus Altiarchaeales archaeon]|nr:MAG: DUF763 domain-containing protein [Candidatus Altiarchaeales archaeon]